MKTAILFGACGNVGACLLQMLLASDRYSQVKIVVSPHLLSIFFVLPAATKPTYPSLLIETY